jgi:hypothetical protein
MSTTGLTNGLAMSRMDGYCVNAGLAGLSADTSRKTYRSPVFICDSERMAYQPNKCCQRAASSQRAKKSLWGKRRTS